MKYIFFIIIFPLSTRDCENVYSWGGNSAPWRYVRSPQKSCGGRCAKPATTMKQAARWCKCIQSTSRSLQLCNSATHSTVYTRFPEARFAPWHSQFAFERVHISTAQTSVAMVTRSHIGTVVPGVVYMRPIFIIVIMTAVWRRGRIPPPWPCDEKGSLETETAKYGHGSYGTRTRKWLRWRGPVAIVNDRPVLSSEKASQINKPALSDNNQELVVSPRWVLYSKTDWPADRRS
jgi:hypothetical protein